tara:strand:- start:854 stop:1291 length:438 start_codon:yes stop_codon:yes gene_type:complete
MSEIFTDTIRKTGGTLGTDIRVKNTSTIEAGSGTSFTHNLSTSVLKAFLHFDGSDNTIGDSLNIGSVTDNGTGNYVYNYTNNFDSDEHSFAGMCADIGYGAGGPAREADGSGTGSLETRHYGNYGAAPTQQDPTDAGCFMAGDLA